MKSKLNSYYFHASGWDFCVLVKIFGNEFDAIKQTADILPPEAAPYENPDCKTLAGKPIITLEEYRRMSND